MLSDSGRENDIGRNCFARLVNAALLVPARTSSLLRESRCSCLFFSPFVPPFLVLLALGPRSPFSLFVDPLFPSSLSVDSLWGSRRRGDALPDHPLTTCQWFSGPIRLTIDDKSAICICE